MCDGKLNLVCILFYRMRRNRYNARDCDEGLTDYVINFHSPEKLFFYELITSTKEYQTE